ACRAGTASDYWTGPVLRPVAARFDKPEGPVAVGTYLPNPFGLYDMHGNVQERCLDGGLLARVATEDATDPVGAVGVGGRTAPRGGSFWMNDQSCRSSHRYLWPTSHASNGLGFRVLLEVKPRDPDSASGKAAAQP